MGRPAIGTLHWEVVNQWDSVESTVYVKHETLRSLGNPVVVRSRLMVVTEHCAGGSWKTRPVLKGKVTDTMALASDAHRKGWEQGRDAVVERVRYCISHEWSIEQLIREIRGLPYPGEAQEGGSDG